MKVKVSRRKDSVYLAFYHRPGGHTTVGPFDMRNFLTFHCSAIRQLPAVTRLAYRLALWNQGEEPWLARLDGKWYASMAEFKEHKLARKGRMAA
jgi:hypothetical protein